MSKDSSMMKILNPQYEHRLISRGFLRYIGPALTSLLFAQIAPVVDAFCIAGKLGEIESVLNSYPSVRSCIVLVMKKAKLFQRLIILQLQIRHLQMKEQTLTAASQQVYAL